MTSFYETKNQTITYCNSNQLNRNDMEYYNITIFSVVHPDLVAGRLTGQFTSLDMERLWTELSEQLNACVGGATKSHRRWKKVIYYLLLVLVKIIIYLNIIDCVNNLSNIILQNILLST
jgi:hypothetical protein